MNKKQSIVISSGKGGTGKTFVSVNLARVLEREGKTVTYLDCDVEEPNGHLFLQPAITSEHDVSIESVTGIDSETCTACGACVEACRYNALAEINDKVLFFPELCHACGACSVVCPNDSILEGDRPIGVIMHGTSSAIDVHYGYLKTGEGGMSPRVIREVKKHHGKNITILDSPPGTSCPVVETVKDADLCVLVTDPTPFGIHDLILSVDMCRKVGQEPVIVINRAEYFNNNLEEYCRQEQLVIIGEIPDDREVAEWYSDGELACEKSEKYYDLFSKLAGKLVEHADTRKSVLRNGSSKKSQVTETHSMQEIDVKVNDSGYKPKEVVVISGKGGTGKTSLTASLCALAGPVAISDCDVDASDLHLVLDPQLTNQGLFSGGSHAVIDQPLCIGCGKCLEVCRFNAIQEERFAFGSRFTIDSGTCEGCGTCSYVCRTDAISFEPSINGEWFESTTRFGPMSHARLGIAEENSGKLVTLIRNRKNRLAFEHNLELSIIDGSPGTGCPVIASVTGTDYAIIVTEPTVSGVHDLKRILDVARHFNIKAGVVVNKCDLNRTKADEIRQVADQFDSDFLGTIPYDKNVTAAQVKGLSVVEYKDNETTEAIKRIWSRIQTAIGIPHDVTKHTSIKGI
jgi:MinD superfamily P-loop ATPase